MKFPAMTPFKPGFSLASFTFPGNKIVPRYLLEMARNFSVQLHSEPVLCKRFLPWMDLLVSAEGDICSSTYSSPEALHQRFNEVVELANGTHEVLHRRSEWMRAPVSFGLVRWWPIEVRTRASDMLGPFKVSIDCTDPCFPDVEFQDCLLNFDPVFASEAREQFSD